MLRGQLFFIFFIFQISLVFAQKKQTETEHHEHFPTHHTSLKKKKPHKVKKDKYSHLYITNGKRVFYGSPCAVEETHKMGFQYVAEPNGANGSRSRAGKCWNNFWVKTGLFFTRSPFWKMTLNRRIRKCKIRMGDTVG